MKFENIEGTYIAFLMVSLLRELKWYIMVLSKYLQEERGHSLFTEKQFNNSPLEQWFFVSQIPLCLQTVQLNVIRTSRAYFHIAWSLTHRLHSHMLIWKKIYIYIYMWDTWAAYWDLRLTDTSLTAFLTLSGNQIYSCQYGLSKDWEVILKIFLPGILWFNFQIKLYYDIQN